MNKTILFIRANALLAPYSLTMEELKLLLWRYVSCVSYAECSRLMEDDTQALMTREAVRQKIQKALQYIRRKNRKDMEE